MISLEQAVENDIVELIRDAEQLILHGGGNSGNYMVHGFTKKDLIKAAKVINDPEKVDMRRGKNWMEYAVLEDGIEKGSVTLFYEKE